MIPGDFVQFSTFNGIVMQGDILAIVDWNNDQLALVRYWWNPEGDPPRKPYTLVKTNKLRLTEPLSHPYICAPNGDWF